MSLLLTKTLGSVSLDQAYMHHFADGLYGFPEEKEFALLEDGDDSPSSGSSLLSRPTLPLL